MLNVVDHWPEGFLDARADELHGLLGGPTLIHLPGRRPEPLFVSTLLHGDELTSLEAIQSLLRGYKDRELPRALSIFVGNVEAARHGVRRLDGQPDYNRIWPGAETAPVSESEMMRQVVDAMAARRTFASVDVHNNSGLNPHYACVNVVDHRYLHLATLFSRTVVYFTRPRGVQSAAMARVCPAVTVECGQSGEAYATEHAREFLDACLNLAEIPAHPVPEHDLDLFHTVVTVKVPEQVSFSFDGREADIEFEPDLDHLNFRELQPGTRLGRLRDDSRVRLLAWDNDGREVGGAYFCYSDGVLRLDRAVMPSMLSVNERAVRQDCLCYLMERYDLAARGG